MDYPDKNKKQQIICYVPWQMKSIRTINFSYLKMPIYAENARFYQVSRHSIF